MTTTTTSESAAKKNVAKLQRAIVDGLEDVKGQDIQVFNTEHLSPLFERVVVASGTSNRQTKALAASVVDKVREAGFPKPRIEGEENGEWIIVDCGAAVAHVMQPAIRQYYRLEELWGELPVRLKLGAAKPAAPVKKAAAKKSAAKPATKTAAKPAAKKATPAAGSKTAPAAKKTVAKPAAAAKKPATAKAPAKAPAKASAKASAKAPAKAPAKRSTSPAGKTVPASATRAPRKSAAKPSAVADSTPVQKLVVKPRKAPVKAGAVAKAPARKAPAKR